MGIFGFGQDHKNNAWIALKDLTELATINEKSNTKSQIIFKHSTRCSISMMAKSRMEKGLETISKKADVYYLDLLNYRNISNQIAELWEVEHESPQIIVIKNGKVIYFSSHHMIQPDEVLNQL